MSPIPTDLFQGDGGWVSEGRRAGLQWKGENPKPGLVARPGRRAPGGRQGSRSADGDDARGRWSREGGRLSLLDAAILGRTTRAGTPGGYAVSGAQPVRRPCRAVGQARGWVLR